MTLTHHLTNTAPPDVNGDSSPLDLFFAQFDHLITRPADIPA